MRAIGITSLLMVAVGCNYFAPISGAEAQEADDVGRCLHAYVLQMQEYKEHNLTFNVRPGHREIRIKVFGDLIDSQRISIVQYLNKNALNITKKPINIVFMSKDGNSKLSEQMLGNP